MGKIFGSLSELGQFLALEDWAVNLLIVIIGIAVLILIIWRISDSYKIGRLRVSESLNLALHTSNIAGDTARHLSNFINRANLMQIDALEGLIKHLFGKIILRLAEPGKDLEDLNEVVSVRSTLGKIEDDIKRKRLYSIWESAILETEKERLLSFYLIPYEVLKNKKIPDADYAMIKKIREEVICAKVGDKNFINAVDAALTAVDNQEAIEKLKTLVARLKGGGNGHGHRR